MKNSITDPGCICHRGLLSLCDETVLDDWNHNDEIVWTGEKGESIAEQAANNMYFIYNKVSLPIL